MTSTVEIIGNRKTPTKISNLVLDATLSINHKYVNEKSSYPVENGSDIADHVRLLPEVVTIKGHFTTHPLRILEGQIPLEVDRVDLAHTELLRLMGRRVPKQVGEQQQNIGVPAVIDIVSGLRIYTNMIIIDCDIPETPQNKNSLEFTIICEQFQTAETQFAIVNNTSELDGRAPNIRDQAQKKVNAGVTKTEEVPVSSSLNQIIDFLSGKTEEAQSPISGAQQ